jgi:hypothetical protein
MVQILPSNTFTTAKWIVSATASDGTHTTIASAITSASSGDTIFIRPGTYTENPTLKAGVNLTAFDSDSSQNGTGVVIINGNCTLSTAGSVTISGIQLQTNSAALLTVSGSAASIVNLQNCYLNCSNNTGITFSTSNAAAQINLNNCNANLGTTGIGYFTSTSAGTLSLYYCNFSNSGASTTASTTSSGPINMYWTKFSAAMSTSSTGMFSFQMCNVDTTAINTTCLTTAGTGISTVYGGYWASGSASCISLGAGTTGNILSISINSSNTNAITGAGTALSNGVSFITSHQSNVTAQTGGAASGLTQGTEPSAGFLGEIIFSSVLQASAITLSNATAANITTISLTAGIWNVSGIGCFPGSSITGTDFAISIGLTSNTLGISGQNQAETPYPPTVGGAVTLTIPALRVAVNTTTTVYLVAYAAFTVGTVKACGLISATRVG